MISRKQGESRHVWRSPNISIVRPASWSTAIRYSALNASSSGDSSMRRVGIGSHRFPLEVVPAAIFPVMPGKRFGQRSFNDAEPPLLCPLVRAVQVELAEHQAECAGH